MENEQLGFFDYEQESLKFESEDVKLDIAKVVFEAGESLTWQELFSGFDSMKAITFSSGIGFIGQLISKFKSAEIIFGSEQVMSYALNEVMAFQNKIIEKIRSSKVKDMLKDRIGEGSLKLLVARKKLSHEKIYLLSSDSGEKRVVMGSANMSYQAFRGFQRENIVYMDGEEAYEWYLNVYNSLRTDCSDEISQKSLLVSDDCEHLDELPVSRTVAVNKVLEIVPDDSEKDNVEFALDVNNCSIKMKVLVPKADRKGKIVLSPSKITSMKTHAVQEKQNELDKRREYPRLVVDIENKSAELNGKILDLNPPSEDIRNDVSLLIQYLNGYEKFHGDYKYMQKRYFEFANWFFCSPFMAPMRDVANRYNQNLLPYPIFGIIYGQSKAGKTSFLETLLKMMIGQKTRINAPDFTRKSIDALRNEVMGAPIIVDDLTQSRFSQHAVETIKNDGFGFTEKNINYPAVVISANDDVKAVAPEIIRRTVICRVQAGLTNTEVMKSTLVKKVQNSVGTAFYREYLRRMFDKTAELIEMMKDDDTDSAPDILKYSSEIIFDIISENYNEEMPWYIKKLTIDDYFSEKVTGKQAIQTINKAWKTSRESFIIDRKVNELRFNAGQTYEADRIIKELPETLEPHKVREWVVMNLDEAKVYFGNDFRRNFLERFRN